MQNLPAPIASVVRDRAAALSVLVESSNKFFVHHILDMLISGLVLMSTLAVFSLFLTFGWLPRTAKILLKVNVWL